MGSNNKQQTGYGPNAGRSGGDPRGRAQNQSQYQQQRYEQQQGPMVNMMGYNYGRGSEADFSNYNDIMGRYRNYFDSGGGGVSGGRAGYTDPFKSYGGYEEFSKTGGYSPEDIANMRARGTAPVRAAYGNAEREIGRQRSLQGGYSPNAIATQAKMAREQGQLGADAMQNVEAGLAEARNRGKLAGLGGMSDIERSRLGADVDVSKFNAGMQLDESMANNRDRLNALQGMSNLYGTTPGMSNAFGNQLLQGVGQGGNFGLGLLGQDIASQQLPGRYEQTMGRFKDIYNTGATVAYPWLDAWRRRQGGGQTGYDPNRDQLGT